MRSFDVFFDLRLNKRLSKQSRRRWFETPSHSLRRHCNVMCWNLEAKTKWPPVYKRILLNKSFGFSNEISMKYINTGPADNMTALIQIMVWRKAIIWNNTTPVYWRMYAYLGFNELSYEIRKGLDCLHISNEVIKGLDYLPIPELHQMMMTSNFGIGSIHDNMICFIYLYSLFGGILSD